MHRIFAKRHHQSWGPPARNTLNQPPGTVAPRPCTLFTHTHHSHVNSRGWSGAVLCTDPNGGLMVNMAAEETQRMTGLHHTAKVWRGH